MNHTIIFLVLDNRNKLMSPLFVDLYEKRAYQKLKFRSTSCFVNDEHCVKSVLIRNFFWSISLRIQSKYRKIRTRKTPIMNTFHAVQVNLKNTNLLLMMANVEIDQTITGLFTKDK